MIETDTLGAVGMAGLTPVAGPHESEVDMTCEIESTIANAPISWVRGLVRAALAALIHYARDGPMLIGLVAAADAPNADTHRLRLACEFERFGEISDLLHQFILCRQMFLRHFDDTETE